MTPARPVKAAAEIPLLPSRGDAAGTHRRLLEEALVLFGDRGFHGVSVREIATAAGIRASSVYAHLSSKEQLLFELMLIGHEEHHDQLRHALLEAGTDPVAQIDHLVRAHVLVHTTYPQLCRLANRELAALSPASQERVLAVRLQSEALFGDVIDRGTRLGAFAVPDTWLAVAAIAGAGIRISEWWEARAGYDAEDVAASYSTFAVRLLTGFPA